MADDYLVWLQDLRMDDVGRVGGKNASLGELIGELAPLGIRVPGGFATTAQAFRDFLAADGHKWRSPDRLLPLQVSVKVGGHKWLFRTANVAAAVG